MSDQQLIKIGTITKTHGLKGECLLRTFSGSDSVIEKIPEVIVRCDGQDIPLIIEKVRATPKGWLLKFEGIQTIDDVEPLINQSVWVSVEVLPKIEESENYYLYELEGARVITEEGKPVGQIMKVESLTEHNTVLWVNEGKREPLGIPLVDHYVSSFDRKKQILTVKNIENLLDPNE